jgi:heterodisulfide reductase subunit C
METKAPDSDQLLVEDLDPSFCDEVASLPGGEHIRKCFACGTCAAGCPVTDIDEEYNPRKIVRQVLLGMREEVLSSPLIWFCLVCYRCYARCPQKVNFTDVMRVLRYLAVKGGYAPPDILSRVEEVDRYTQLLRRDMMKETLEGRREILKEIKAKIGQPAGEKG